MNDEPLRQARPGKRAPLNPPTQDPPDDGYPPEKDVSTPPPDSDVKAGRHKKPDDGDP